METSSKNKKTSEKNNFTKPLPRNMPKIQQEQRLIAICVLFFCLLNFPILSIVNQDISIGGIPLLFVYIFLVWILLIGAFAWIVERKEKINIEQEP